MTKKPELKKYTLPALLFFSVISLSALSFLSLDMAFAALGIFSIAVLATYERIRRAYWEQASDYKMKTLLAKHNKMAKQVVQNRDDIATLRATQSAPVSAAPVADNIQEPVANDTPAPAPQPVSFSKFLKQAEPPKAFRPPMQNLVEENSDYSDSVVKELLAQSLDKDKVDAFIQPIVHIPSQSAPYYEVFSRLRANRYSCIPADRYIKLAQDNGYLKDLDAVLLIECLKSIKETAGLQSGPSFFLNITSKTLRDTQFMSKVLVFVSKNRELAPRLIFEFPQADYLQMPIPVLEIVRGLGQLGVQFSVDHVALNTGGLTLDVRDMKRFNVRFVKIEAQALKHMLSNEELSLRVRKYKRQLEANGIQLIAEKIENKEDMDTLAELELLYAQGYHFGRPALQNVYSPIFEQRRQA